MYNSPIANPQNIFELFSHCASRYPDGEALIAPECPPLIYEELFTLIKNVHRQLNSLGLGSGQRIASILPNSPEAAVAFLAVSASASFAPLNPGLTMLELERDLTNLSPDAVLVLSDTDNDTLLTIAQRLHIPIIELIPDSAKGAGWFSLQGETNLEPIKTDFAGPDDIALLLYTSGSTANAKLVPILHQAICQSCLKVAAFMGLTNQDRCLNALPLFHVHGLISALVLPLTAGGSCAYVSDFQAESFIHNLGIYDPTWYPAPPTIHKAILTQIKQTPDFRKNPSLRFIRSGSAPLTAELLNELEEAIGVPVIEPYGMSEAVHISSNPMPPAVRKRGSVGISYGICEIHVIDHTGCDVPAMKEGEIVIQGPTVIKAYIGDSRANEEAFCPHGFRTGDLGYLDHDGYLFISGRVKEVINRGGEKVSPAEVDRVLSAHPAIKEVVTFPVPHPSLGENIAAAVVFKDGQQVSTEALRQFARQTLSDFKVPYRILISDDLPKGATGKIQRHKMADYFAGQLAIRDSNSLQEGLADDRSLTPMQRDLCGIWREILHIDSNRIDDNFFELGGNSLLAMQLLVRINQRFDVELPLPSLFESPTIIGISNHLEILLKGGKVESKSPIKRLQRQPYQKTSPTRP